jgi:hypothetical protein
MQGVSIMAKKTPKKTTDVNAPVPTPNAAPHISTPENGRVTAAASSAAETEKPVSRPVRKPEIVTTASRANLFPINLDDEIRQLAYLLSERRGFQSGHETEDWLNAEQQVLARYHQTSA